MQLPLVAPAPLVVTHAVAFRDLFENRKQFRHFQNYLTGLMVLPNKSMANIARCILDSADKTNLSRFLSAAPWSQEQLNRRRIEYMLAHTQAVRQPKSESAVVIDDTLCEHVGDLFEYVDRHYDHGDGSYPLAHNLVTSHYVSGAVRFPLDARLYRRYEELTQWEAFVHKHFPDQEIPPQAKARARLHKQVDETLLQDTEFAALHEQFHTKIDLAVELVEAAIRQRVRFGLLLFDGWYLSERLVAVAQRRRKDWISILKKNRNLETQSFVLRDADDQPLTFDHPHIAVQDLVPLIPNNAFREVRVEGQTYWTFTFTARIPTLGKVRLVISYQNTDRTGTYVALVSNRLDWSAQQIIAKYLRRWPIETFYQDGKGHLGLDEYQMRNAEAIGKHWCLVFVAYSLLHLECLPPSLTKATLPLKSIGEACRQQAQALIEQLIWFAHQQLEQGVTMQAILAYLFSKQKLVSLAP